jgi:Zinc-finger double-stranded RNA-binding
MELWKNRVRKRSARFVVVAGQAAIEGGDRNVGGGRKGGATTTEEDDDKPGVVCLSAVKDERIEALPRNLLPAPPPAKRKKSNTKKRSRADQSDDVDDKGDASTKKGKPGTAFSGLEAAVREVLGSYVPRSSEHLPFYCRVCATQLSNLEEFERHQRTEFHQTAVKVERAVSYCKLCRKQLTSPAQLREHVVSRPHKDRLERVRRNHHRR